MLRIQEEQHSLRKEKKYLGRFFKNASIVVNPFPDPDWIRIQVG
jgi:hypothetical protein